MNKIAFFDTEIEPDKRKILDIGCITNNQHIFHKNSIPEFVAFVQNIPFICGHNVIKHDLKFIGSALAAVGFRYSRIIDTLYLSPLLFPAKPYHALLKDDKLLPD